MGTQTDAIELGSEDGDGGETQEPGIRVQKMWQIDSIEMKRG